MGVAVFDANVFVHLYATGPRRHEAERTLSHYDPIAPDHVLVEFANVMRRLVRLDEMSADDADEAVAALPGLVRTVPSPLLVPSAYQASGHVGHGVYDCLYLILAEAMGCPLVSEDHRFLNKARPFATVPLIEMADMPSELP